MRRKHDAVFYGGFVLPAVIVYTLFMIYPVAMSAGYSLTEWNGVTAKTFVGLGNFQELIADGDYWQVVRNTGQLIAYSLIFQVGAGLAIAYLLAKVMRGFRFFRSVIFIPVIISPVAIGLMFSLFYNSDTGPLNHLLDSLSLSSWKRQWLSDPHTVLKAVMAPQIWQYIGLYVVIFLAAIQQVPEELVESARMDGAGPFRTFFNVVMPQIWDVFQVCVILAVTGSLKSFDHAWVITSGGPGNASSFIALQMFKTAFISNQIGYGSAMTITILAYAALFTMLFKRICARLYN
ncbi:carbohydrate ABC transporter permease [Cohnella phaseoli]|uniref:Raffinose/stachyose/melibiose transport system permease protein n=1 Tax=Cohnella phaseoli TaxID=456490 RepID=A0A3D9KN48_9BACL|nr:sugar ABC transporter permease [Cohnella phaseoli]RED87598.1 raffinose/stachyose/melibiose transport system permease protein [Cohnella phaseoli]